MCRKLLPSHPALEPPPTHLTPCILLLHYLMMGTTECSEVPLPASPYIIHCLIRGNSCSWQVLVWECQSLCWENSVTLAPCVGILFWTWCLCGGKIQWGGYMIIGAVMRARVDAIYCCPWQRGWEEHRLLRSGWQGGQPVSTFTQVASIALSLYTTWMCPSACLSHAEKSGGRYRPYISQTTLWERCLRPTPFPHSETACNTILPTPNSCLNKNYMALRSLPRWLSVWDVPIILPPACTQSGLINRFCPFVSQFVQNKCLVYILGEL